MPLPIDLDKDVAVGISLPLINGPGGYFRQTYTTLEQVTSNVLNLLLTIPGERVMQPEFGSTLMDVVFNQGPDVENDIDEAIREAVSNWLPYVIINEINMFQQGNQVDVSIDFSVTLEPDSFDTLTFNFNIGE